MTRQQFQQDQEGVHEEMKECCGRKVNCCGSFENERDQNKESGNQEVNDSSTKQEDSQITLSESEYNKLKAELEDYKDRYLRTLAEMDNIRKRLQKEKQDMGRFAIESVILDFLTPFDQFEHALQYTDHMSDEIKNWAFGFNMILNQLKDALANQNIIAFDSVGTEFNPHLHEAVEVVETDEHPPGTVIKQYYRGYKLGDRVIRPARVQVAKKIEEKTTENEQEAN